jgi:hypothetical protein
MLSTLPGTGDPAALMEWRGATSPRYASSWWITRLSGQVRRVGNISSRRERVLVRLPGEEPVTRDYHETAGRRIGEYRAAGEAMIVAALPRSSSLSALDLFAIMTGPGLRLAVDEPRSRREAG